MALWAGLATNLFFGLLRAVLLIALYGQRSEVNGLTVWGAVTYVGVTQAMIAYLSLFGSMDLTQCHIFRGGGFRSSAAGSVFCILDGARFWKISGQPGRPGSILYAFVSFILPG